MSLAVLIGVGLLGGAGAIARFVLDGAVSRAAAGSFPLGTLTVNLLGAFALGVLAGAGVAGDASRLAATGFIGAFTTFSTWALESHRLSEDGELGLGWLNLLGSLAAGLAAAWLGRTIGGAF
jgi:fluoride exporter